MDEYGHVWFFRDGKLKVENGGVLGSIEYSWKGMTWETEIANQGWFLNLNTGLVHL